MSNAWIKTTATTIPPTALEVFQVDSIANFGVNPFGGTSSPIANIERLTGDNGIQTEVNSVTNNIIRIKFQSSSVTTVDATPTIVQQIGMSTNSTLTFQVIVAGFCLSLGQGVGGDTIVTAIDVGGIASIVGSPTFNLESGVGLIGCSVTINTTGIDNLVNITVTGKAATTIDWSSCTPGQVIA